MTRYALVCSNYRITIRTAILFSAAGSLIPFVLLSFGLFEIWGKLGYDYKSGEDTLDINVEIF